MSESKLNWEGHPVVVGAWNSIELWPVEKEKLNMVVLSYRDLDMIETIYPDLEERMEMYTVGGSLIGHTYMADEDVVELIGALKDYLAWRKKQKQQTNI